MPFLEYIVQIATAISLLATAAAAVWSLGTYAQKQQSERAEIDVRLMQLFDEWMRIAQSRGQSHFSETWVEQLFEKKIITKKDFQGIENGISDRLFNTLRAGSILIPTSKANQDAAIAAIAVLAKRHPVLRRPARAGLEAIMENQGQKQQAEKALEHLDQMEPDLWKWFFEKTA